MMPAAVIGRRGRGLRRGLQIGAVALGAGLVAVHSEACYALAADGWRSLTDSYLVMWIERTGAALGCV